MRSLISLPLIFLCSFFNPLGASSVPDKAPGSEQAKGPAYHTDIQKILAETPEHMTGKQPIGLESFFPDASFTLIPSLAQSGLYCGYYALYNALCFLHPKQYARNNVEQFKDFFAQKLAVIRNRRCKSNCQNLLASELKELVGDENIAIIQVSSMLDRSNEKLPTLAEILDNERSAHLIHAFLGESVDAKTSGTEAVQAPQINNLVLICGKGDPRLGIPGHWVAMYAVREATRIDILVADSARQIQSGLLPDVYYRERLIESFYYMLTHGSMEWKNFWTQERVQKFFPDGGAEGFALKPVANTFKFESYNVTGNVHLGQVQELPLGYFIMSASQLNGLAELYESLERLIRYFIGLEQTFRHYGNNTENMINVIADGAAQEDIAKLIEFPFDVLLKLNLRDVNTLSSEYFVQIVQYVAKISGLHQRLNGFDDATEIAPLLEILQDLISSYPNVREKFLFLIDLSSLHLRIPQEHLISLSAPKTDIAKSSAILLGKGALQAAIPMMLSNKQNQEASGLHAEAQEERAQGGAEPIKTIFDAINAKNKRQLIEYATRQTINAPDANGHTPLQVAIISKNTDAVNWLIHIKQHKPTITIDLNAVDREGYTALHYAAATGIRELVAALLNNGACANVYRVDQRSVWTKSGCVADERSEELQNDDDCRTPLHIAARFGHAPVVEELLTNKQNKASIDVQDYFGATPLIDAVSAGYHDVINLLLGHSAQCNFSVNRDRCWSQWTGDFFTHFGNFLFFIPPLAPVNCYTAMSCDIGFTSPFRASANMAACQPLNRGQTALHRAVLKNDSYVVGELIKHGAFVDARDVEGQTPLIIAAQSGHEKIAQLLVAHKAAVNAVALPLCCIVGKLTQERADELLGITPLTEAARGGHCAIVEALINAHADVNYGRSKALRVAIKNDKTDVVRFLLNHGATLYYLNEEQKSSYWVKYLFHEAAESGNCEQLKALFTPETFVDTTDADDTRPLHYAAYRGHLEAAKELRARMASLREPNNMGLIPLHCAVASGHRNVARYLLAQDMYGDDTLNAQNIFGLTPLHAAIMAGQVEVACDLIDNGASTSVRSNRQLTPFDYARATLATKFYFMPQETIAEIVQEHSSDSPVEDEANISLDIAQSFNGLFIRGSIVPSLQQIRADFSPSGYCGYYALYNALSFLDPENILRLDRKQFREFFKPALQEIWNLRKHGPYDYLMAHEIRHLVNTFYKEKPVIVLDKNALYCAISGTMSLEKAFGKDERSVNLWRQFIAHDNEQAELVLMAGTGANSCHWIAIHCKRDKDMVTINVADSLRKVARWQHSNMIYSTVFPFYYALTNAENGWASFFTQDIKDDVFEEYVTAENSTLPTKVSQANILSSTVGKFVKALDNANASFHFLLTAQAPCVHLGFEQIILLQLRFKKLVKTMAEAFRVLLICKSLMLKIMNPLTQKIDAVITLINAQFYPLIDKVQMTGNSRSFPEASDINALKMINEIFDVLKLLRCKSQDLVDCVDGNDDLAVDENLFDASMLALDAEHLKCVMESAPEHIRLIINHLKGSQGDKQLIRLLFVGPPGNGKTTLAQAIAQECSRPLRIVRASALGDTYQYSRERDLKTLLPFIQKNPNAVILIDELDAIKDFKDEPSRTAQVLQSIIDLCNRRYPNVIFIATTNDKKLVPEALYSRFCQDVIDIKNPDYALRLKIINRCCACLTVRKIKHNLSKGDLSAIASQADKFSIRDIESMFRTAIITASGKPEGLYVRRSFISWLLRRPPVGMQTITAQTLDDAFKVVLAAIESGKAAEDAKPARWFTWSNAEKVLQLSKTAFDVGVQIYQMRQHTRERIEDKIERDTIHREDKKERDTIRAEDKTCQKSAANWQKASIIGGWICSAAGPVLSFALQVIIGRYFPAHSIVEHIHKFA